MLSELLLLIVDGIVQLECAGLSSTALLSGSCGSSRKPVSCCHLVVGQPAEVGLDEGPVAD